MMNNDIKKLLSRFMAGETTPEEERQIAEYMRTFNAKTDDEKAFKEMFAWFDNGMPMENDMPKVAYHERRTGIRSIITVIAAAAAVLLLLMVWHGNVGERTAEPVAQMKENRATATESKPDSTAADTAVTIKPKRKSKLRTYRKHRYSTVIPKTYLAESSRDSINKLGEVLADAKLAEIEMRQAEMLEAIEDMSRLYDEGINLYISSLESEGYEDYEEETVK